MKTLIAVMMVLCFLSVGCGGGSKTSSTFSNPLPAISNGPTLATVTSYWGDEDCVSGYLMGIEFASDGSFQSIVTGTGPGSTTCTGNVIYQPTGAELILGGSCSGPGPGGDIANMTGIVGSTSSGSFTAASTTVSMNQGATYDGCRFTLEQGQQGQQ